MGKVSFKSDVIHLDAPAQQVYVLLSNLDNMQNLMPEQVINWQSNGTSCSFEIKGMTHIHLIIGQLIENKLVNINSGPGNPKNNPAVPGSRNEYDAADDGLHSPSEPCQHHGGKIAGSI